jgi:uncharacterized repeat protein (TIGR01451 family)
MKYRILHAVMVAAIALSMIAPAVAAPAPASANAVAASQLQVPPAPATPGPLPVLKANASAKPGVHAAPAARVYGETDPAGTTPAVYIVQLEAAPLASYRGGIGDLPATSPAATGAALDMARAAEATYASYLQGQQAATLQSIQQQLGRPVEVKFTYQAALNGFALVLTPKEAARVLVLPGVQRVQRDFIDYPQTDYGPAWIGAGAIWNGAGVPASYGAGIVVGVLDTGINFQSPSFARVGGDNFISANPRNRFYGVCDPESQIYDPQFICQEKLIGAWDFADNLGTLDNDEQDGPADNNGHGSHTASTAAGNFVNASMVAPTVVVNANVSGVAPHANIIAYDVCLPSGCPGSALIAGLNQAVLDGVDVINYSIGGGSRDPWQSADALAMLAAYDAGIFVAVSAGNEGPAPSTVGSPANAPWVTAAAASTHDRRFVNTLTLTGGSSTPAPIVGQSITGAAGPAPVVSATDVQNSTGSADAYCSAPFATGSLAGKIVLCERGINGRVEKGANVLAGGAVGMILMNDAANGSSLIADAHVLPAVHITHAEGVSLRNWLATGANHRGAISGTTKDVNSAYGDILASFSSRGPDAAGPNVLKPDVAAPGVDILAASHVAGNYMVMSGTSMASPHLAGAAALLAAQHPTWTPAEIRSALMLSAVETVRKEDGTTPADAFDAGSGRIDLRLAPRVGFVLDEAAYAFELANPATGGDPSALNLASLADSNCVQTCTWTRTVHSVLDSTITYNTTPINSAGLSISVQPASFTLNPGASQVLTITANVTGAPLDEWVFGAVDIRRAVNQMGQDANAVSNMQHFPVAVRARAGAAPAALDEIRIETRRNAGIYTVSGLQALTTPTLVKKLYVGSTQLVSGTLEADPTQDDPWDIAAGGIYTRLVAITDPTVALLAVQVAETMAKDLDLYVGYDANGDGRPSEDEVLCTSATASPFELCELPDPGDGVFWILLQNWEGSGSPVDTFTLSITQVARNNQSSQFKVTGPSAAALGVPFAVDIQWDFPDMHEGSAAFGLLELGTSNSQPNNIVSLPVKLLRLADDVLVLSTADAGRGEFAHPGEQVDFTLVVSPEPTAPSPTNYVLTATLPAGLTYMPGQGVLRTSAGTVNLEPVVAGNQLIWNLQGIATTPRYIQSTNDPESETYSPFCDSPFGGYVHLEDFGIELQPSVDGNGRTWNVDSFYGGSTPYSFFGNKYPSLYFTDDAVLSVVGFDPNLNTGVNAPIPTAALPNNLIAPLWGDFKVVYDEEAGTGVRIAGVGGGALMFVEYDGLQSATGQGSINVEAIIARAVSPFDPEIVFAYDRAAGALPGVVTGVENASGAVGAAYSGPVGADNQVICYDWTADEIVLQYSTTVGANVAPDTELATTIASSLSARGTKRAVVHTPVFVTGVELSVAQSGPTRVSPGFPITYTLTVANAGTATATNVDVQAQLPLGAKYVAGGALLPSGIVSFTVPSLAGGAETRLNYSFVLDTFDAAQFNAASVQSPSIIGGEIAADGAWPWQAALWNNAWDAPWGCGASLISRGWVLTAAHCVTDDDGLPNVQPPNLSVVLGVNDLTKAVQGQRIAVSEIIVHPDYHVATEYDSDLALLRLATPAVLNDKVQVVGLVGKFDAGLYAPNTPSVVTGWGTLTPGWPDYPDALYQVEMPIVAQTACAFSYAAQKGVITDNMLCAGVIEGGKDSCQGDSGGPLVVRGGSGWLQAGVVSWGNGCGLPGLPGVYTRLGAFVDYVSDTQHTLSSRGYFATDNTGLPGHSDLGATVITTLVKPIRSYLPIIGKK